MSVDPEQPESPALDAQPDADIEEQQENLGDAGRQGGGSVIYE